jgi:hypothetical protein
MPLISYLRSFIWAWTHPFQQSRHDLQVHEASSCGFIRSRPDSEHWGHVGSSSLTGLGLEDVDVVGSERARSV